MNPQVEVMWVSSAALKKAFEKGFSVTPYETVAPGDWCKVVPQPSMPGASVAKVGFEALHVPVVATALITTAVGIEGVNGLAISDVSTDNDCSPFGVTEQVQQEISSSAGSKP